MVSRTWMKRMDKSAAAMAALITAALVSSGCATGLSGDSYAGGSVAAAAVHVTGNVHGGQQAVSGSTIQLYTVGTTGLKSASTPLIGATVLSDQYGNFSITGQYSCTSATQVYITATGGNPGTGSNNSTIQMMAALGACSSLNSNTFVQINELTTVAAAYAFQPFAFDATHIGATGSSPAGLLNAFSNAQALVSTAYGQAGVTSLGAGVSVPVTELNTLGNILAACINSTGSTSTQCSTLATAAGSSTSFSAALGIARNSGASAVTALWSLPTGQPPFQPAYSSAPRDFSVAITSTANAKLAAPYGIAIDASGNAWVTNLSSTNLVAIAPTGALLSNATTLNLSGAQGVAVDRAGNVWVASTATDKVVKATVSAGAVTGSSTFTTGGLAAPRAIAMDSAGNAWIANFNGASLTGLTSAGAALSGSPFTQTGLTKPTGVVVNSSGNVLVNSGSGAVLTFSNAGAYVSTATDNALQGALGLTLDPAGDAIASGFTTGSTSSGAVGMFSSAGAASGVSPVAIGTAVTPVGAAADGTSLWVANAASSGGLMQLSYGSSAVASPSAGFGSLNMPEGVAVDASGSVWTANAGSNTVSKFIGLASAPVATPIAANVGP